MDAQPTLIADISAAFERACLERDFEVAEYLFQALEAIAQREHDDAALQQAFGVLVHALPRDTAH